MVLNWSMPGVPLFMTIWTAGALLLVVTLASATAVAEACWGPTFQRAMTAALASGWTRTDSAAGLSLAAVVVAMLAAGTVEPGDTWSSTSAVFGDGVSPVA